MYFKTLMLSFCFVSFSTFASEESSRDLEKEVPNRLPIRADSDAPAWNIDVENDMHYCYRTKADLTFWRSSEDETVLLTIEAQQAEITKKYRWLADAGQTIHWFKSLPISEQETYSITMGEVVEHQLVLHKTSGSTQQMYQLNCIRQARLLEK